jgi:hypothetical protein
MDIPGCKYFVALFFPRGAVAARAFNVIFEYGVLEFIKPRCELSNLALRENESGDPKDRAGVELRMLATDERPDVAKLVQEYEMHGSATYRSTKAHTTSCAGSGNESGDIPTLLTHRCMSGASSFQVKNALSNQPAQRAKPLIFLLNDGRPSNVP